MDLREKSSDTIISYVGRGVDYLVEKSLGEKNINLFNVVKEIFVDYYLTHCTDESNLFPNVEEILEYYRNKRKFVVTNRKKEAADIALNQFKIRNYFEDVFGEDGECRKPSVCVFNKLTSNNANIDIGKTIIIGDMDIDIKMGKNAGIKTCWVTYGFGEKKDVASLNPDIVIDNMIELKNVIK